MRSNEATVCLLVSAHMVNTGPLRVTECYIYLFCISSLLISLFKMHPKLSAEVLSSVPRFGKAVMCLTEKTHVRSAPSRHELCCCWL